MSEATTTTNFRQRLASHMFDNTTLPPVAYMAFGDGGHTVFDTGVSGVKPADANRTTLYHELLRKSLAGLIQEDSLSLTATGRIENTDLIGQTISEAALLDSAGNMLGFRNFAPKVKEGDETYDIKIKLKF